MKSNRAMLAPADVGTSPDRTWQWYPVPVPGPYRLDLTVSALRRSPANPVDVLTPTGEYMRWVSGGADAEAVRVRQVHAGLLDVGIDAAESEHPRLLALVTRTLGATTDLTPFYHAARHIAWLSPLVSRMWGVKPPRYPTLWDACLNAVIFQQISLAAASAIMHRLVTRGPSIERDGIVLYRPPDASLFNGGHDASLRAAGVSAGKLATLRRVAEALDAGTLDETRLEALPSAEAAIVLRGIKGIGPWTAAVILLRGFGRLDVFPSNDSSVARNLALVSESAPADLDRVLAALHPQQGMLYYHLLLKRLEARDALPR